MILDAHGDILTDMYNQKKKGMKDSFKKRHLKMYKEAGVTHSIFVNWTNPKTDNPNLFNEIFNNAFLELGKNDDIFYICKNTEDMHESVKQNKIGVIIGIEGIMQLEDTNQLRDLYDKGVRHASLTWNEVNKYAAGLNSETEGLTLLGKEVLDTMQELGMIIDLSHLNPRSFSEVIEYVKGPVIISHGNIKNICNHIRNYTDEQLQMIKEKNGVIGICGIAPFIASEKDNQTVQTMVQHIDYAVKTIGIDHVGLGFDFCYYLYDGVENNHVEGLQSMSDVGNVFMELSKLGYSKEEINKIKYENFYRVIKEVIR